jgi:hypothetical protein
MILGVFFTDCEYVLFALAALVFFGIKWIMRLSKVAGFVNLRSG